MKCAVKFGSPLCLAILFLASMAHAREGDDSAGQLLSAEQGQALADFAARSGPGVRPKPDCSHLVHLLYSRAGLNYEYQESRRLRLGVPEFARVKTPQPGDLVVWPGHVGIVLSPEEKIFLSSVRPGITTQAWDDDYWSSRGRPRFLRYIVGPQADLAMLADVGQRSSSSGPVKAARAIAETPDSSMASSEAAPSDDDRVPAALATIHQRSKPDKQDIANSFNRGGIDLARRLLGGQSLGAGTSVSIVERVEVKQLKIKHQEGTIRLKLTETLALEHGRAKPGGVVERELMLDRRDGAWIISDPNRRLYIPRQDAEQVLEKQLQLMLQDDSDNTDKRSLVRALNLLYDREDAGARRASAVPPAVSHTR
ncbi:MAG TPA: NlpC/P60 family protein [Candidatus Limnocylindrales bacterium]|jgi:hypothetical protein|nr:NlpC/P60 family protein [Candidatus Limnocylindrales bacterium]